jgi:hypothetical protein
MRAQPIPRFPEHVLRDVVNWMSSIRVLQTASNQGPAVGRQILLIGIVKFRIVLTPPQNRHLMLEGRRAGGVK